MSIMNYQQIRRFANMPIYIDGPHSDTELVLNSRFQFGHYNPEFVQWLNKNAIPAMQDPEFKRLTQSLYKQFVQAVARPYYIVYLDLQKNPEYRDTEQTQYAGLIEKAVLPEFYGEDYYYFSGLYEQGYNGNVVQRAVLFWLRRHIDNTADTFFQGLETLIKTYDTDFILDYQCQQAKTDDEEIQCAKNHYMAADKILNTEYKTLMKKLGKQSRLELKKAQRAWIEFRDNNAQFSAGFYRGLKNDKVALIEAKASITQERSAELKTFANEIQ
jgi:uncharacterized protein YecT (DUF1311 family)